MMRSITVLPMTLIMMKTLIKSASVDNLILNLIRIMNLNVIVMKWAYALLELGVNLNLDCKN